MLLSSVSSYKPMPKLLLAELIIPNQVSPVRTSVRLFHITGHPVGMTEYLLTEYHLKLFSTSNNTHTRLMALLSGITQVSQYQKGKTNLDFTEARDTEWQWHQLGDMQVCTSLQTDNHASTPPLSFFTGRMPFLPPNQQRQSTEGK